jgi:hypothetical protein
MKLDRNINGTGRGKYGLVNNRKLQEYLAVLPGGAKSGMPRSVEEEELEFEAMKIHNAVRFLEDMGILDWGLEGTASEFFVVKLRDQHAEDALTAYARSALNGGDVEYYHDVRALSDRAGIFSPFCKKPELPTC